MPTRPDLKTFRTQGHEMVDWIADYLEGEVRSHSVLSRVNPGDLSSALPERMPEAGEDPKVIWRDFKRQVLPGVTHWNHPGFMAYFGISSSGPGILGEMLSAALNVNGMLWRTCPAATELELVVMDWMRRGLELPEGWLGFLCDTASISSLLGLAAAREAALPEVRQRGLHESGPLRVYASDQAHSSIAKACLTLGLGLDGFRSIGHDADYRMDVTALRKAIAEDRRAGIRPLAVVATVGTTSTTSVDPVPAIAEICRAERLWLHVDAAYAGSAALCPEYRWCLNGCEHADSFVFNPHKWLFVPIDASALYTRHPDTFRRAFSLIPEYLTTPHTGQVVDLMDYGVQLGRRFRALKLWWVLRTFGLAGLQDHLRTHIDLAQGFADWVDKQPGLQKLAPSPFSVVCFRVLADGVDKGKDLDAWNMRLMEWVNQSGEVFLSHTRLDDGIALRVAIGNLATGPTDLERLRTLITEGVACLSNP